jgi:hypothetical protein
MRPILQLVLAMVILPATLSGPVRAQDNAVYLVTYIEVMPNAVASGAALLERYSDASRNEIGNLSFPDWREYRFHATQVTVVARPTSPKHSLWRLR